MKPIDQIIRTLSKIPGALSNEEESEWVYRGDSSAITSFGSLSTPGESLRAIAESPEQGQTSEADSPPIDPVFEIPAEITSQQVVMALDGDAGECIRARLRHDGIDGLAAYSSFRYSQFRQWGIYITVSSVFLVWRDYFSTLPNVDFSTQVALAARALIRHELMHFAVDYAVAQVECIAQRAFYLEGRRSLKKFHQDHLGVSYNPDEEALANAYLLHSFGRGFRLFIVPGSLNAAKKLVTDTPEIGYREGLRIHQDREFDERARQVLIAYVREHDGYTGWMSGVDLLRLYPDLYRLDARRCPIHFMNDQVRLNLPKLDIFFMPALAGVEETSSFQDQLAQLESNVRKRWAKTKETLTQTTQARGLDFKHWPLKESGIYSVRVTDGIRAHLKRSPPGEPWKAIEIGTHKAMGHG